MALFTDAAGRCSFGVVGRGEGGAEVHGCSIVFMHERRWDDCMSFCTKPEIRGLDLPAYHLSRHLSDTGSSVEVYQSLYWAVRGRE